MKRNILILFAVVSLIISLTGCGGSGSSNYIAPTTTTMTSVRVCITQNGQPTSNANVALYTPAAAMREGLSQAQDNASFRASIDIGNSEGVYTPVSTSANGIYTFNVPTGEYTLIANKGTSKAVVTNFRADVTAEQEQNNITVAELSPTGTISGSVSISGNTGATVAGTLVYLEKTSFVAIADSNGNYKITGVPVGNNTYSIVATINQNGKTYSAQSKEVPLNETNLLVSNFNLTLVEINPFGSTTTVTGSVIDNNSKPIANILVLATDEENLIATKTDTNGKFELNLYKDDYYSVYVHGSNEKGQNVEIGNDGKVKIILNGATVTSLKFTMNSTSSSYGCVKGKIKLSDDFAGMIDADSDLSDIDRYLVRLIGSSTTETYYSTQTRADFKCSSDQDQNEVDYSFDNIPEGTYSVFVDPAGNGFFGSVGNVVVTAGNTTNVEDVITVTFVKPVFTANLSSDIVNIIEVYPFMLDNSEATEPSSSISITARNISSEMNMTTSTEYITGSKFDYQLMTGNGVIPQKLEISITKSWEDNTATGLRGALTGTYIVENQVDTTDTIGSFIVTRAMGTGIEVAGATATEIDIDTDIIKYSDNSISCIEAYNNQYYYYKNNTTMGTNFTSVRVSSEITEGSLLQDSIGQYAVYNDSDSEAAANYSEKLCFLDGGNESNTPIVIDRYSDNNNIAYYQYRSVSIAKNLTDKYVAYCLYKVTTAGGGGDSLIKLINLSNPNNKIDIATFDNGDYSPNYVRLSLSKDGTPYLLVLLQRSPDHYATIHIYNCSNPSSPIVDCDLDIKLEKVSDFRVLEDGSFYVEINDSCFDDYTPEGSYSNSFRFLANFNDPVEDSCLANRKYCFMDKQGFMYRLDKANKAIIKTTSLDGQPIETYKGFTGEINEGGPVYNPVNGIVGVKEDGSTLYIW